MAASPAFNNIWQHSYFDRFYYIFAIAVVTLETQVVLLVFSLELGISRVAV